MTDAHVLRSREPWIAAGTGWLAPIASGAFEGVSEGVNVTYAPIDVQGNALERVRRPRTP